MEQIQSDLSKPMEWTDMMNIFVGKGHVRRAAIYDLNGKCLAASEDPNIPQEEIISIVRSLKENYVVLNKPIFALFFGEERYVCFHATPNTIVGRTAKDFFVAYRCDDFVIIAFADIIVNPKFSCIGEVWTFGSELRSRMEISAFIGWVNSPPSNVQYFATDPNVIMIGDIVFCLIIIDIDKKFMWPHNGVWNICWRLHQSLIVTPTSFISLQCNVSCIYYKWKCDQTVNEGYNFDMQKKTCLLYELFMYIYMLFIHVELFCTFLKRLWM